jgi:tetratricopeptide (TPR) repeat protein
LGLIAAEEGNWRAAIDYFQKRVLEADFGGEWTHGAKYNLARVYEAAGQPDKAIELYESDVRAPSYRGNLIRARWLGSKTTRLPAEVTPKTPPVAQPPKKPADKPSPQPAGKSNDKPSGQPAGSPAAPSADRKTP